MKRILLAVVLDLVSIGGLFLFLGFPGTDTPPVKNFLQSLLCETGETVLTESHSGIDSDGDMVTSTNFYCVPPDGDSRARDVTGKAVIYAIVSFLVPFGISMILFFSGGASLKKRYGESMTSMMGQFESLSASAAGAGGSLTERLKALKQAYDQGLITEAEYESKRQDILTMM